MPTCRICGGPLQPFLDLGRMPLADAFRLPDDPSPEFFFTLAVGCCEACTMVQLMEEVPRERMFHDGYPYHSSGSSVMRDHFETIARRFLDGELAAHEDPLVVELGCNDGVMLHALAEAGVRHLGVEPSGGVARVAEAKGVRVRNAFFEADLAAEVRATDGPAQVVYAANTFCHIPYMDSIFAGLDTLLAPDGIFVFEDPYLGAIVEATAFDQIYDEHFYYFCLRSVEAMVARFGLEVVDVEILGTHGGSLRYWVARAGRRPAAPSVEVVRAREAALGLGDPTTLAAFASRVARIRDDLVDVLTRLRGEGKRVVGYGATAKSATVTNYCGITPELVPFVCDTTPAKQGRLTPGAHLPVRPAPAFADPYPDVALLFAWNHAAEIMANETAFTASGGRWLLYVPEVRLV